MLLSRTGKEYVVPPVTAQGPSDVDFGSGKDWTSGTGGITIIDVDYGIAPTPDPQPTPLPETPPPSPDGQGLGQEPSNASDVGLGGDPAQPSTTAAPQLPLDSGPDAVPRGDGRPGSKGGGGGMHSQPPPGSESSGLSPGLIAGVAVGLAAALAASAAAFVYVRRKRESARLAASVHTKWDAGAGSGSVRPAVPGAAPGGTPAAPRAPGLLSACLRGGGGGGGADPASGDTCSTAGDEELQFDSLATSSVRSGVDSSRSSDPHLSVPAELCAIVTHAGAVAPSAAAVARRSSTGGGLAYTTCSVLSGQPSVGSLGDGAATPTGSPTQLLRTSRSTVAGAAPAPRSSALASASSAAAPTRMGSLPPAADSACGAGTRCVEAGEAAATAGVPFAPPSIGGCLLLAHAVQVSSFPPMHCPTTCTRTCCGSHSCRLSTHRGFLLPRLLTTPNALPHYDPLKYMLLAPQLQFSDVQRFLCCLVTKLPSPAALADCLNPQLSTSATVSSLQAADPLPSNTIP